MTGTMASVNSSIAHQQSLVDQVAGVSWYHSLRLPGGIVTPGVFDTLDQVRRVPFPASLEGRRCLDIGTADGFWAFEMERRGADEVIAIDVRPENLDWPRARRPLADQAAFHPRGFELARDALESKVQLRELSTYDLSPESIGGGFDFIFMGSLLGHLRDPVAALTAVGTVLVGEFLSVDAISLPLTCLHPRQAIARIEAPSWPLWWVPNLQAYRRLFDAAGLEIVACGRPFFLKRGRCYKEVYGSPPKVTRPPLHRLKRAVGGRFGNLHAWVTAKPA